MLAAGLCGLTGSSWPYSTHLDRLLSAEQRARHVELFGQAQPIRSDEWGVEMGASRAQMFSTPDFPTVNPNLGLGELQRTSYDVAIEDWGLAFRPLVWPLLTKTRWSYGVRWFLRSALLLLGLYAFFRAMLRGKDAPEIAAWAALAVSFSSPFTWWLSGVFPEPVIFACFAVACCQQHARATTSRRRLLWLAAFAWCCTCAFFFFYAPMWGPLLWILAAALLDVQRKEGVPFFRSALMVAVLGACVALAIFYFAPYVALVSHTAYPGKRVALAGQMPFRRLLDMMWPSLQVFTRPSGAALYVGHEAGQNVCEASSALEIFPFFLLTGVALVSTRVRAAIVAAVRSNPWSTAVLALLLAWLLLPLPRSFGTLTLLQWSPWMRVLFPLGLSTALLTASCLALLPDASTGRGLRTRELVAAASVVVLGLFAAAQQITIPGNGRAHALPLLLASALGLAAVAVLGARSSRLLLGLAWCVPLVIANFAVTPVTRTRELFVEGPGHAVVNEALARVPGRLLDYATHFGNELASRGWPVLAATYFAPDLDLFQFLGPETGLDVTTYNRYANVGFSMPPTPSKMYSPDSFIATVSPCSKRLEALFVNHLLVAPGSGLPPACARDFVEARAGDLLLWSRRRPVCRFGVAAGQGTSALDFDFHCDAAPQPAFVPERDGFSVRARGDAGHDLALALNRSLVSSVACEGATYRFADAHLLIHPAGSEGFRCDVRWLGSASALGRLASGK